MREKERGHVHLINLIIFAAAAYFAWYTWQFWNAGQLQEVLSGALQNAQAFLAELRQMR